MIRRTTVAAAAGLLLLAPVVAGAQQADLKIGYVDSEAIIQKAPGYTEANEEFNRTAQAWRDSLETSRTRLQGMFEEYKQQEVILSPEKKTERQQEILQLENEIQNNGWLHCAADPDLIFGEPEFKYERAMRKLGIAPGMLSSEAGHA